MRFYLGVLIILVVGGIANAEEIKIVTEHFPPFQFAEGAKVTKGFSVEIMQELLKETGVKAEIKAYPWARAYRMALKEKNVLIFSITRSEERELLFKWVGSIIGSGDSLWSLKERDDIVIHSLKDAKRYMIAVPRDDIQHQFLKQRGFDAPIHLYLVPRWEQAIKMLYNKRVDLMMGSELSLVYRLKALNLDYSKLKKVYEIGQQWGDLSIAFSKSTSDIWVHKFQEALEKIKKDGTYEKIHGKWIK